MSSWVAALLFAIGGSAWAYNVLMKQTGSNTKASIVLTAMAFLFLFAVFWSAFDMITGATN